MPFAVARSSGVPLSEQVREQLERLIRLGVWEKGDKLPTERELAAMLGVSRNTVSAAYRALERVGLLSARQGSGTYVAYDLRPTGGRERIRAMLGMVFDRADELGIGYGDVLELAKEEFLRRDQDFSGLTVAFVECNREQLVCFSNELASSSGVTVRGVLVDELRGDAGALRRAVASMDMVVTTLFHLDEVRRLLPDLNVLGVAVAEDIETMVRIARCPPGKRMGLVCISDKFATGVRSSLASAGLGGELPVFTGFDRLELEEFIDGLDVVLASPARLSEVKRLRGHRAVIEFVHRLDAGSVNMLRSVMAELKARSRG